MRVEENTGKILFVKMQASQQIIRGISDALGPGQFQHIADTIQPVIQEVLLIYDFTDADTKSWHNMGQSTPKYEQMIKEVIARVLQRLAMQSQQAQQKGVRQKW